jgi:CoA:oxalate CoA-transferase
MTATTREAVPETDAGPLAGVKVIDMTHALAGPFATMLLGDLGATVFKIERPGQGDHARIMPPLVGGMGVGFAASNRNKQSVAIDAGRPEGRDLLLALAERADAVVHNFRPGTMEKLGLSADEFRRVNPSIVFAGISGFGQEGPWRRRAAYDPTMQALAGVSAITGSPGTPAPAGIAVGDLVAPLFTVIGVVAALYEVRGSHGGRTIDVGMFDALFNMHAHRIAIFDAIGKAPVPSGERRADAYPMGTFATADGFIVIAALNEQFWLNLCDALGRAEWNDPERYGSMRARSKKRDQLFAEIREVFPARTTAEWTEVLMAHDVPCGEVTEYESLMHSALVADRRLLDSVTIKDTDGDSSELKVPARPLKWSDFDMGVKLSPPRVGQHTQQVLESELGLSAAEISALADREIIELGS